MRKIITFVIMVLSAATIPATVSAHVVVKPNQVGAGAFQTFTTSVPNEKEKAVTAVRLQIPAGLKGVSPTVKPGWEVTTEKSDDNVTEINWNGGSIPAGMRDDFTFSAQAPAKPGSLQWKAYQTYEDGTVVSWDQTPASNGHDDEGADEGPYSTTDVINDLHKPGGAAAQSTGNATGAYVLSGLALVLAVVALAAKRK